MDENETTNGEESPEEEVPLHFEGGTIVTTLEEAEEMHEKSLEALSRRYPDMAPKLRAYKPQAKLIEVEDGQFDLQFRDYRLYETGHREYAEKHLEEFWERPVRFRQSPPLPANMDKDAGAFLLNVLKGVAAEKLTFHGDRPSRKGYVTMTLGIGLGGQIDALVKETDCEGILLIEPHLEFLYHSTFTYDWAALMEYFEKIGNPIHIQVNDNPTTIAEWARSASRQVNPVAIDGITIYQHYPNHALVEAIDTMNREKQLFSTGLGFFEDETFMLRHTFRNLFKGDSRIFVGKPHRLAHVPVVIVGGGPSKDEHFEVIRELSDRAIVMSAGGALDSLLAEGIRPDFHVLIERDNVWGDWLEETASEYDLSEINFIGSTTVDPRTVQEFAERVFFFRRGLSSFPLFGLEQSALHFCDPEVVNGAVDFAQQSGFRTFYFFGVDLGCKSPDYHHSKNSHALKKNTMTKKLNMRVPGNFGGEILTHSGWDWVRDSLERSIRYISRGRQYFNCSDGALIRGTIPTAAETVTLPELPGGKEAAVREMLDYYPVFEKEVFQKYWYGFDQKDSLRSLGDDLLDAAEGWHRDDSQHYITRMMKLLIDHPGPSLSTAMVYRGTMFQLVNGVQFYESRIKEPEDDPDGGTNRAKLDKVVRGELKVTIKDLRDRMIELLEGLDQEWEEHYGEAPPTPEELAETT